MKVNLVAVLVLVAVYGQNAGAWHAQPAASAGPRPTDPRILSFRMNISKGGVNTGGDKGRLNVMGPKGNDSKDVAGYRLTVETYPSNHGDTKILTYSIKDASGNLVCKGTDYLPTRLEEFIWLHPTCKDPKTGSNISLTVLNDQFWKDMEGDSATVLPPKNKAGKPLSMTFTVSGGKDEKEPLNLEEKLPTNESIQSADSSDTASADGYSAVVSTYPSARKGTRIVDVSIRDKEGNSIQYLSKYVSSLEDTLFLSGQVKDPKTGKEISYKIRNTDFWKKIADSLKK